MASTTAFFEYDRAGYLSRWVKKGDARNRYGRRSARQKFANPQEMIDYTVPVFPSTNLMTSKTLFPEQIRQLVIAGWTGRDRIAQEKHIAELELLGVRRPATTPVYYRVSSSRLTTSESIEVVGHDSSGEVEFVVLMTGGSLWIGVGSDHTDRKVETYNITVSKQICEKPMAREIWLFDELKDHWDSLVLRSWAVKGGSRSLYQEGTASAMLHPQDLIAGYVRAGGSFDEGTAMFGGTLAAIGGIQPADRFQFELEDPVHGLRLAHSYDIHNLPVAG